MAKREQVAACARTGGPVNDCHYLACAEGKCIERPGVVVKMFKRMSKLEPSAPISQSQVKGRKRR